MSIYDIASNITVHDSLMIVIIAHGSSEGFRIRADTTNTEAINNPSFQGGWMNYSDLGDYINVKFGNHSSRKYAVMIVVNQACFSGAMMQYLCGENRILISAADSGHESWTEEAFQLSGIWLQPPYEHFAFLYQGRMKKLYDNGQFFFPTYDGFIPNMGNLENPNSLSYMYEKGDYAEHRNGDYYDESCSYPMMINIDLNPEKTYL